MFRKCTALTSINFGSKWFTSKVKDFQGMFKECSGIGTLNLSTWDTALVFDMSMMFESCTSLTTITLGPKWVTKPILSIGGMFFNCPKLTSVTGTNDNKIKDSFKNKNIPNPITEPPVYPSA
jgi:surface protein